MFRIGEGGRGDEQNPVSSCKLGGLGACFPEKFVDSGILENFDTKMSLM